MGGTSVQGPGQQMAPTADQIFSGDGNWPDSGLSFARMPPRLPGSAVALPKRRRPRVRLGTSTCTLPRFRETPAHSIVHLLTEAFQQTNPRGTGCCAWHVAIFAFMHKI